MEGLIFLGFRALLHEMLFWMRFGRVWGRVLLFLIFGVCKISCRSGTVLEGSGGRVFLAFWPILAGF